MKHVKVFEEFVGESKEEQIAKDIIQDLLNEYDPWEIQNMDPQDAKDTVDAYGYKGSKAAKIADYLINFAQAGAFESKINEAEDNKVTLNVTISNIDQETADDFLQMFAFMEWCGNVGTARTMRAFFDGDGHFRPKIKVEGHDLRDIEVKEPTEDKQIDLDLGFGA